MTTILTHAKTFLIALTAVALAACSGGSDPAATGPSSATVRGAVQGTAAGLRVNDVTFRTTGAHLHMPDDGPSPVLLEDEDAVRNHLDDGMVVTIRGTIDDDGTGDAVEIEFHDLMEATIDDKGGGRITLLGEDLSVDDSTEIVDRHGNALTPDDLGVGDRVEVSGHGDGRGGLRATFVRVRDDNAALHRDHEAKGWVIAIAGDVLDLAFTKDGPLAIRVDLSGIASPPAIAVGSFVEVSFPEGNPDPGGDGVLDAVAIHLEDPFDGSPEDEMEIEGIVTAVDAAGFTVAGQPVVPDAGVRFVGGTADDLVVGVKVEVEGRLGDDGVLHAHKVAFKASVRADANLEAADGAAGTLTLLGIVAYVTPSTELRSFASLGDLNADDRVEVRGYPTRDGLGINATRIERISTSPNDRAFLRAVVAAKSPTSALTMLGRTIDTSAASHKDQAEAELTPAAFFAAITEGQTVVKVRWRPYPASTAEPIDEAELEN